MTFAQSEAPACGMAHYAQNASTRVELCGDFL